MTIHLSKDLEQFVHDAVKAGLYAREDDVIRDALLRLRRSMPEAAGGPSRNPRGGKATQSQPPLDLAELGRRLLASGLVERLPDPAEDIDDDTPDDQPIAIRGEPLSETILRERR